MANYAFSGFVFQSPEGLPIVNCDTYNGRYYCVNPSQIQNYAIYYQGYFNSASPAVTPSKWSPVYTTGAKGQISCNLGDADWLGPTASVNQLSTVVFVFWEAKAGNDRTNPAVLHTKRGWIETSWLLGSSMSIYPLLAFTPIHYIYSDDMPERYGSQYQTYNFHYSSTNPTTYECDIFRYYLPYYPFTSYNTPKAITMSQVDTKYSQQLFPTIDSIRETLTFSDGDYKQRTLSATTTDFTHSFDSFTSSKLVRTVEYEVGGVYYPDTIYSGSIWQDMIIETFFSEYNIKKPAVYDIKVYRDRDFKIRINTDRVDYWTFRAQIKEKYNSTTALATFDITINQEEEYLELYLDADTTRELIDDITIGVNVTSSIKTLVWDLKFVTPTGKTYNFVKGNCYVYRTITRGE